MCVCGGGGGGGGGRCGAGGAYSGSGKDGLYKKVPITNIGNPRLYDAWDPK